MVRQAQLNTETARDEHAELMAAGTSAGSDPLAASDTCIDKQAFDSFYASVSSAPWRTLVSAPWRDEEHINALELRAALLAVHWALSAPSSLCSRVYILLDSAVAFFSLWKGRSSSPK